MKMLVIGLLAMVAAPVLAEPVKVKSHVRKDGTYVAPHVRSAPDGKVDTDLDGSIETVNGDVTVGVGSHVKGGIRVEKPTGNWGPRMGKPKVPRIVIGPNAVVEGSLVFEREVTLHVHQSARIGKVSGASVRPYTTATPPRD